MRRLARVAGLARAARDRRPDLAAAEAMAMGGGGAAGSRKRGGENGQIGSYLPSPAGMTRNPGTARSGLRTRTAQ
jgi:hypothetical protein